MTAYNRSDWFKKIVALTGLVSLGIGIGIPVQAKFTEGEITKSVKVAQMPTTTALDVVDTAVSAGEFTILAQALKAAGLVDTLKGDGPFTVFAPTDKAFQALPAGTLEELLKPENKAKLVQILTYHVVPGKVLSTDLKSGEVTTVEGSSVTVKVGSSVMVDNATVIKADVPAKNGVIHVIDTVIIPQ